MPIIAAIVFAIQLCFVIHAIKTRRATYWYFIIMAAPVLGCIAYYVVEVFPSTRESARAERAVNRAIRGIGKAVDPSKDLRERTADVETCGSVDNRLALARQCIDAGLGAEAVKLVQSCLTGPFVADPNIRLLLVQAALAADRHDVGLATVAQLRADSPSFKPADVALYQARLLEQAGNAEAALSTYAEVLPNSSGEETRVRYALLLKKNGQTDHARALFEATARNADRLGAGYRDFHREWIARARRELTSMSRA